MKKVLISILAVLYLGIASGVMVNVHYCMGNLSSVEYGSQEKEICGTCGMKEKKGCCHTEYKLVKIEDAHHLVKINIDFIQLPAEASFYSTISPLIADKVKRIETQYHSPPDRRDNEVYLHNRVFRI